ncbi:MAG: CarD family transcriptional regulator, partial [Pseudomonadota bacterium]
MANSAAFAEPVALESRPQRHLVASAIEGRDALFLAELAQSQPIGELVHVARDGPRAAHLAELLKFFAPDLEVILLPAWDCLPYDRVSPNQDVMAERLDALARLLDRDREVSSARQRIIITTVNALLQKLPPPEVVRSGLFAAEAGERIDREQLLVCLARNGYRRAGTVVEPGEYAVRGGIIDVYPTGSEQPLRLDLFGDDLEAIRGFDPLTQRSLSRVARFELRPVSEVLLDEGTIARFRVGYLQHFGAATGDPLFESVCAGRPFPGMEHWLPLFHERLVGLDAYLQPGCPISFDHQAEDVITARQELIGEHYESRRSPPEAARSMGATPYRPLRPDELYLSEHQILGLSESRERFDLSTFAAPPSSRSDVQVTDLETRTGREFAAERARQDVNLFDQVAEHVAAERAAGRRVLIAAASDGSLERLRMVLQDHGVEASRKVEQWSEVEGGGETALAVLPLEHGFVTATHSILAEPDIFGDRLARPTRRKRRADQFIAEVAALAEGDLVVHNDHGIGRYDGLITLEI